MKNPHHVAPKFLLTGLVLELHHSVNPLTVDACIQAAHAIDGLRRAKGVPSILR